MTLPETTGLAGTLALAIAVAPWLGGCSAQPSKGPEDRDRRIEPGPDASTDGETSGEPDGGHGPEGGPETCNGLDDDGDGSVDEGCSCTIGATQPCYPRSQSPAAGCRRGEQTCEGSGAWGECSGATVPAPGEEDCCSLSDDPEHPLYEAFRAAYPAADMPMSVDAIRNFMPEADGHMVQWSEVNPGDELVDPDNGGVIDDNIQAGRRMSREAAEDTIPAAAEIVDVVEGPVTIEDLGGSGSCIGEGWAWGSILYRTEDGGVHELVYLYIGYCCCSDPDNDDIEAFYYSAQAMEICASPVLF